MPTLRLRHLWLVALISLCLVVLCAITAVSLLRQQATLAVSMKENVSSRRAATELEECLNDLVTLLRHRVEAVSSLHDRVQAHLDLLHQCADHEEEQQIAVRLDHQFDVYKHCWASIPPPTKPDHAQAIEGLAHFLETDVMHTCQEFEQYNDHRIDDSTEVQERILGRLSWGMAGVGGLGGIAGIVLGFGVARGVRRSLHRLQVQLRDAAGKIDRMPEIVLTEEGDFGRLHADMDRLTARIEKVVQQLQERETEVLRAEQLAAVGQLAAGVAHEIHNPLTSIKLLVQAGLEEGDSGLSDEDLCVIEHEILRMEGSLRTFLDFARPSQPERRHIELAPLIQTALGLVRGRAEKQHVRVEVEMPADPVLLLADSGQLHQVLVNLLLNALDAMPSGGRLTLRVPSRDKPAPAGWVIEVTDTGPGIPAGLLPRLFKPFVSGKDTGMGLGLVISRRIVETHGGTLTAANRPEGGAVFTVVLPTGEKGLQQPQW
jgi:signal transduction histidine kinase